MEVPQYGFGSKENDYGLGFYCTQSNDLAKECACPTVQSGFSNKYELDMNGLRVLYLNSEEYHILKALIKFYVQCFDRPAFRDDIRQEGHMEDFDKAIEDTISPFIIQSLQQDELITLDRNEKPLAEEYSGESIEDIAEDIMGVHIPQYSERKIKMHDAAAAFFAALKQGKSKEDMKLCA